MKFNLLGFYNNNKKFYPRVLGEIGLRANSMPACSFDAERGFSDAGNVLTDRRMAMGQDNQADHVMAYQNRALIDKVFQRTGSFPGLDITGALLALDKIVV
jgi:hypothetical protein